MNDHVPTSALLDALIREAPGEQMSLAWLLDGLHERSYGVVMLILGLLALVPGLSIFAGLLIAWPAIQMMLARRTPWLPGLIARRPLPTRRIAKLMTRALPVMRWLEWLVQPRWPAPFRMTKRAVGAAILLLGLTLAGPVPFSQIVPALAIVLIAIAYLEEDGLMLSISLGIAAISLAISIATIWGAVIGIEELNRLI